MLKLKNLVFSITAGIFVSVIFLNGSGLFEKYFQSFIASPVYSQQSGGLKISPMVQWNDDVDGNFSYCVYEGVVTLDSVNDPTPYCLNPSDNTSLENMFSKSGDGINTYNLDQIVTPRGLFKDGAPYSVCVTFFPSSQDVNYKSVETCQTFTNTPGSHIEEPFINLDEGNFVS